MAKYFTCLHFVGQSVIELEILPEEKMEQFTLNALYVNVYTGMSLEAG
jgi:hypothetical protein